MPDDITNKRITALYWLTIALIKVIKQYLPSYVLGDLEMREADAREAFGQKR